MKLIFALIITLSSAFGAQAQCRLALILALDISSSVDQTERQLQIEGVAAALEDLEVQEALFSIPNAPVALMVFEWSGQWDQTILQDWVEITGPDKIPGITARLRNTPRSRTNLPTAMGPALIYARSEFAHAPVCAQQKVDVSGDGKNNDGVQPYRAYQLFNWHGITVNGLAIESDEEGLSAYYRGTVIHGAEAFVETASSFEDFAQAFKRKLLRELGVMRLGQR